MADEIDLANDLVDRALQSSLNRIRQTTAQETAEGSKLCIECGDEIPEGRQKLGFKLCVPCAEEAERRDALFA